MRIKKLELCGFKSFKDRTVIHFDAGITGIVGPNGCGKSNIVDALVWVMGEQSAKHLRGSAMQDVIFGGAEGYAPSGMAEVSLTLENDGGAFPTKYLGHSEVMVTRRLHRSGESAYLINKEPARLKDIHEIFMDTGAGSKGFSIIEQGAIGKIITAKPQERRTLIEEAAGITKFKVRKRESERKLTSTDQNLLRLNDIIAELKRQIDHLERQAKKAERYRKLKNEVEDLDLWLSSIRFKELKDSADEARELYASLKSSEDARNLQLEELESNFEKKRQEADVLEKQMSEEQDRQEEYNQALQDKRMALQNLQFEVEQARRKEEMTGSLMSELTARKEILEADLAEMQSKSQQLKQDLQGLEEAFRHENETYLEQSRQIIEKEEDYASLNQKLSQYGQELSSLEGSHQAYIHQQEDGKKVIEEANVILEDLRKKVKELERVATKAREEWEASKQLSLSLTDDVDLLSQNKSAVLAKVEEKRQEVETYKDELNQITSRLYGLENLHANFEGFQEGVKSVMMWQKKRVQHADGRVSESHELKPVSDVVSVEQDYELAMEAALGQRLQLLLSDSGPQALEAVDHLKAEKSGRSSFLPLGELPSYENQSIEGLTTLRSLISCPDKYRAAVDHMTHNIAVVDSINQAMELRGQHRDWTFVTKEGDTLSADGILTGGTAESAASGILKRGREIKELSQKKQECAGKLALSQQALQKLEAQLNNMEEELKKAQRSHAEQEIRLAELRKDNERAENEWKNAQASVDMQIREISKLEKNAEEISSKIRQMQNERQALEDKQQSSEERMQTLKQEITSLKQGIDDLQSRATEAKVAAAEKRQAVEGVERQASMLQTSLNEVSDKLNSMNQEKTESQTQISSNQRLLEQERVELEKFEAEIKMKKEALVSSRESFERVYSEVRALEDEVSAIRKENSEKVSTMNEAQLKSEQAKMKEDYLVEQIQERYQKDLNDIYRDYENREGDIKESEKELEELRAKLKRLGEVNLSSINEYDETVERYEFLAKQQEDLLNAKKELQRVIDRINRICSRRFKETFEAVNERFKKAFPVLFGGGEANLTLIEDEVKNEMGIDIMARPPGKKLQSVSLLSGGEKALTAVALIFSIFLVKPSPYCLLDEVDAPLDDANVMRFNDLVKEMAKRSQIIVVTHNKHTMEINKKLYGVTMQERGVSKMVSVSLDDAAKIAEA